MRGKLSTRFVHGLALLLLGGVCALGIVAVPALAGASSSTPTSTAPGVTTAAPRTAAAPAAAAPAVKPLGAPAHPPYCVTTTTGRPAHCAKPVPLSKRPAGARNRSTVTSVPAAGRLASLVDTRTWTSGGGNTFPGADVPFGMVQWSPDTMPTYNAGGGYDYSDTKLWGYSLTHVSGPGCGAAGDVPMVPTTGALPAGDPNQIMTPFSHSGEVAQAGYYSAQSNQPNTITSEFTATPHSSMARFTYPATSQADFLIKLMASQNGDYGDSATGGRQR